MAQVLRLRKLRVSAISLCKRGVNGMPVILKSASAESASGEGAIELKSQVVSKNSRKQLITSLLYLPNRVDRQGHTIDAEELEKAAFDAMRDGVTIDIEHDGVAIDKSRAHLAESYLVSKGDPRFENFKDDEGNPVDATGGWATTIRVTDTELWKSKVESGDIGAFSLAGNAILEPVLKSDSLSQPRQRTMDPQTIALLQTAIAKAVTDSLSPLADSLLKSQTSADDADKAARAAEVRKAERDAALEAEADAEFDLAFSIPTPSPTELLDPETRAAAKQALQKSMQIAGLRPLYRQLKKSPDNQLLMTRYLAAIDKLFPVEKASKPSQNNESFVDWSGPRHDVEFSEDPAAIDEAAQFAASGGGFDISKVVARN
jgi:hypothetical protein